MRGLRLLLAVLCCGLVQLPAAAQNEPSYSNKLSFSIPFQIAPQDVQRVREAQLYESTDGRGNWRLATRIGPGEQKFSVQVTRDGEYWYLLRTVETNGLANPSSLEKLPANVEMMKVIVDTLPPRVEFREAPARGEQIGVTWGVQDENLDPNSLRLDVLNSNGQWTPVGIKQSMRGEAYFTPNVRGRIELRLSIQDLARNLEAKSIIINVGGTERSPDRDTRYDRNRDTSNQDGWGNSESTNRRSSSATDGGRASSREPRYVNKETFSVNFNLEEVGPSGAVIEAFYLADNQWAPCGSQTVKQEGPNKLEVRLPREGNYGLILMVRSGFTNKATAPRASDQPEMWVSIDKTPPKVVDVRVEPGRGAHVGKVKITWNATDRNLAHQPIRLEYRDMDDPESSWQPISDNLDNTRSYVWTAPPRGYRFQIRVAALDKAKNWGEAISPEVIVDVAQPKVRILDIDP
jgi:hypothetical protein